MSRIINPFLAHGGGGGAWSPAVNGKMPIAAWVPSRDDAGNGTTTLTDLVGSNDGTLTNMDAATDWVVNIDAGGARALDFDGTNDYVSVSPRPLANSMSFTAWVRFDSVASRRTILACGLGFAGGAGYRLWLENSDKLTFDTSPDGSATCRVVSTSVPVSNQWYFVCGTYDSALGAAIYVDGVQQGTNASAYGSMAAAEADMLIGARNFSGVSNYHDGLIDDVRIWDQALNSTDVADLYASGSGRGVDAS